MMSTAREVLTTSSPKALLETQTVTVFLLPPKNGQELGFRVDNQALAMEAHFRFIARICSSFPLIRSSSKYLPMAIVGYRRLFETGHAFDYGLALALPRFSKHKDDSKSLRIELRDY